MTDALVLPFLILGLAVGIAAGGFIWLRERGDPEGRAPTGRDFRTLFASGAALFSAGILFSLLFAALEWAWYLPLLLLLIGLVNMSVGLAKRSQWQSR